MSYLSFRRDDHNRAGKTISGREAHTLMNRILFATDGSFSTMKAVEVVKHLLRSWTNAELIVVYVTKPLEYSDDPYPAELERHEEMKARRIEREALDQLFRDFHDRIRFRHVVGQPAITIATVADEEAADLIVVGSHGNGEIDRLLVGSVSHGVVYCAQVPVLVVKDWKKPISSSSPPGPPSDPVRHGRRYWNATMSS